MITRSFPFVTFELAKLAKKHGYSDPTPGYYTWFEDDDEPNSQKREPELELPNDYEFYSKRFINSRTNFNEIKIEYGVEYFSAPTYDELLNWLDNKRIFIDIDHEFGEDWTYCIDYNGSGHNGSDIIFSNRFDATYAAIFEVLNKENLEITAKNYRDA